MTRLRITYVVAALLAAIGEFWALGMIGAKLAGAEPAGNAVTGAVRGLDKALAASPAAAGVALVAAILAVALVLLSLGLAPVDRALAGSAAQPAGTHSDAAALQLLGILQSEGRFVDFLQEEIGGYDDTQVAAAARAIHDGCRRALVERVKLLPVLGGNEGEEITVEENFDPAAIRVTGNVTGQPPYRGVLRHPGWRSEGMRLPRRLQERDPGIIAPAEVEII